MSWSGKQTDKFEMGIFSAFVMVFPAEINSKFSAHNSDILTWFFHFLRDFSATSAIKAQCSYDMAKLDFKKKNCIQSLSNDPKYYLIKKNRFLLLARFYLRSSAPLQIKSLFHYYKVFICKYLVTKRHFFNLQLNTPSGLNQPDTLFYMWHVGILLFRIYWKNEGKGLLDRKLLMPISI